MKNTFAFVILFAGLAVTNIAAQGNGPATTVTSFYKYDWSHRAQPFNRRNLDARKQWLDPTLYKLFREELVKEQKMLAAHPTDKPFFGDGFPFDPVQEQCTANGKSFDYLYSVGSTKFRDDKALVDVRFFYPKPCTEPAITYVVELVKVNNSWLIADFLFPGGNRLSEDMKNHSYGP